MPTTPQSTSKPAAFPSSLVEGRKPVRLSHSGIGNRKAASDTDSHPEQTPDFTPCESPSPNSQTAEDRNKDLDALSTLSKMESKTNEGVTEPAPAEGNTSAKAEIKSQNSAEPEVKRSKNKCKKTHVKHIKKRKTKKVSPSSSDESSSDSSSDSGEATESSEEEDESSESESEDEKTKRKSKGRKSAQKKEKTRRKGKSRKQQDSSSESSLDEEESEESGDESEDEEDIRQKSKSRKKGGKKARKNVTDDEGQPRKITGKRLLARLKEMGFDTAGKSKKSPKSKDHKKGKRASKLEYKRVDQLWDSSIHDYKLTDTSEAQDADEYDQYIFTVRRRFDWEGKYDCTVVDIKSKSLKEMLNEVMDGVKGVSLVEETPSVDPNMLFLYLEELRTHLKSFKAKLRTEKKKKAKKVLIQKQKHLKILVKYLDKDYAETKKTLYPLLESNLITFELLWALFKPNTIAYTPTYGNTDEPRAFKIEYATKECSFMRGTWYNIEGRYLEYDGKSFGMGQMEVTVDQFKGARKITGLSCYPMKYHKDQEALKAKLIARGRKFVDLKGMNYRFHKGMAFYKRKKSIIKVNINGRIMVDPAIHRRINPNYPISTVKPTDPDDEYTDDEEDGESNCSCCDGSSDDERQKGGLSGGLGDNDDVKESTKLKVVLDDKGKAHLVRVTLDAEGDEVQEEKMDKMGEGEEKEQEREFTEDELLIASPVVLGFAFSEKLWLEFTVSGVSEIEWNEGAFDSLVLPDNQKSIVKALVESHKFSAAQTIDDVIQGKGKGLVAVLHGPPGTGKTLTAEGIAELLKCPLYMVSAGELGTDPRTLEAELNKILDIAHSWGAVLLLDEADVFLEKRTIQDIHRNALVSIFLRLLEYFQGILFLTTNRVETFDEAFQSRIHVALRYGELNTKAKKTVWKMFLERVRAMEGVETVPFKESDYDALARNNLNGRQIKNCVRTAQALAVNEKQVLSMEHIKRVLDVAESFDHDLRGGTGYMDAMRSYT
ncbi:MAG: hypothetical protein M1827_001858 [Pycnora praestabilis]|nr:MAG: hypothetical protein M1827_001858 [Pycnora praestabilis]